jgi:hypothetical protein
MVGRSPVKRFLEPIRFSRTLEELMQQAMSRLSSILGCLTLIFVLSAVGHAQFRAAIQGVVTDTGGGTVSGATVTLTSTEMGQTLTTTTSNEGFYRFSNLAPGLYTITVEQQGFKKRVVDNVKADAEVVSGQDITLEAGGISETVTVQADVAELQTEDASVRRTITNEEVVKLPQQGRDPYELLRLTPGIFGTGARSGTGGAVNLPNTSGPGGSNNSIFQTENQVPISANGQRVTSNNYQIDGTSANSQTWGGAAIITPSQESVKELQVTANTYSAEDGRNSGAQIKVITQNGTNDWHGSLFFKYNDPSLNTFNTMPARIGNLVTDGPQQVKQKFRSYGGSVGGPLPMFHFGNGGPFFDSGKDRLFFFFAYEGTRDSTNVPYITWAETPEFRQRLMALRGGTVSGAVISSAGIEPRIIENIAPVLDVSDVNNPRFVCGSQKLSIPAQAVPGGIDFGSIAGTYGQYLSTNASVPGNNVNGGGFDTIPDLQCARFNNPRSSHANQYFARIDLNATDKDRFTFTSITTPSLAQSADASAQSRPQADLISDRLNFAVAFIYNRIFSSTMTNEARFSYSGWGFDELNSNPDANFGLPRIEIEQIWGDRLRFGAQAPGEFKDRQYDFRDTVTKIWGNHVVKLGVAFRHDVNKGGSVSIARPLYSFVRPWNFANGAPVFESISADQNGNPVPNTTVYHTNDLAFFGQDDWKFRPNITLNLGLRWEYFSPITVDEGVIGNLIPGPDGGLAAAHIVTSKKLTDSDYNNFGPQLGLAWMPDRFKSRMVVRTGFGISYDRLANALLDNARRNPPAGQLFGICCAFSNSDLAAQQILYAASTNGGILGYPRHPNIGNGLDPANGLPRNGSVEIYASPLNLPNAYVYRYSLDVQYELGFRTVATVGYTGSAGRHFVRIDRRHITGPSQNPHIFAAYFASPDVNTNYNALITSLRTRFYKGLTVNANYTFGKSIDNSSFEAPCACTDQSFPIDQKEERGRSDFDVRHNFVASAIWDIPFFSNQKSWEGKVLGGWQISTIVTYNTGFPWTPKINSCLQVPAAANFCNVRPTFYNGRQPLSNTDENFVQPGGIFPGGGGAYFNTSLPFNSNPFANRPAVGRNSFFGPKYFATDLSIVKRFGLPNIGILKEGAGIDLRVNFFNVFNNLNFAPFNSNSNPTRVDLPSFGTPTSGLAGRVGELQIRFNF